MVSSLHDIGKLPLAPRHHSSDVATNDIAAARMRQHPELGYELLRESASPVLQEAELIAYAHDERFDGKGYPRRLVAEDIPLSARIVAVADVLDALLARIPAPGPARLAQALAFIRGHSATWFDPAVVDALVARTDALEDSLKTQAPSNTSAAQGAFITPPRASARELA